MYFYVLAIISILLPVFLVYLGILFMNLGVPLALWITILVLMLYESKNWKQRLATILLLTLDILIASYIVYSFIWGILSEV